jgi:hypothetical protein
LCAYLCATTKPFLGFKHPVQKKTYTGGWEFDRSPLQP